MPVLDSATTTHRIITNEGAYNLSDSDDNYTVIYDPAGKYILGDKEILFSDLPADSITIASTKEYLLRMQNFSGQSHNLWLFSVYGDHVIIANDQRDSPLTINFDNGTLTYATDSKTYTSDENVRILNPDGKYTMTMANAPATILKDTTIIVGDGTTTVNQWYNRFYIEGTVENINVTPTEGITVSNIQVNTTPNDEYKEAVTLNSITFDATDGTNTIDATYNRVIVPIEIDAELTQHLTSGQIALMGAIPVMVIVALLMAAVGAIALRRAD
jgi:hypothetical protein